MTGTTALSIRLTSLALSQSDPSTLTNPEGDADAELTPEEEQVIEERDEDLETDEEALEDAEDTENTDETDVPA